MSLRHRFHFQVTMMSMIQLRSDLMFFFKNMLWINKVYGGQLRTANTKENLAILIGEGRNKIKGTCNFFYTSSLCSVNGIDHSWIHEVLLKIR